MTAIPSPVVSITVNTFKNPGNAAEIGRNGRLELYFIDVGKSEYI